MRTNGTVDRSAVGHLTERAVSTRPRSWAPARSPTEPLTIPLTGAPKSKYLLVFVTKMSPTSDNQFQSKINEITVQGS